MTSAPTPQAAPRFSLPPVADNPLGWGPASVSEELSHVPYAPYSKSDRLGKIADWTAPALGDSYGDRRYGGDGDRRRRFGAGQEAFGSGLTSQFAYSVAVDDEASFSVVDRQATVQKKPGFKSQRGGRGGARGGAGGAAGGWQTGGRGGYQGGPGGRGNDRRGQQFGQRRRYGGYNDKPARIRDASVQAGAEWKVVEELDFPRMNKLYFEAGEPEDM